MLTLIERRAHPLLLAIPFLLLLVCASLFQTTEASIGDRLPEFRECVQICEQENCGLDEDHQTPIPILHRLLFWTCPAECDYACQHIITAKRVSAGQGVVQFHGKWPFRRVLGMQEPLSVLFSLGNWAAHYHGMRARIWRYIPPTHPMRPFYVAMSRIGMASWLFSALFHTRDFPMTEMLDYFAAAANVLFGMYYTVVRIFRLDRATPRRRSVLRAWTALCAAMYLAHVSYLGLWRWDYRYNMAANVACGVVQNVLWSWFSFNRYRKSRQGWAVLPGVVVAWVLVAMSMELLDFAPLWEAVDAHSLWHLGTIAPTVIMYNFLVKDAQEELAAERLKR